MFASQQQLHNNTVYPLLNRFLKEGWITQREAEGERGQTRLLYELTEAGRQALIEKLSNFSQSDASSDDAFRLRVGLFSQLQPANRERILRLRDSHLTASLERMEQIAAAHQMEGWSARTFEYVLHEKKEERKWIAELMTRIQET
jgi:DNA-binding PadR family transcriptional regulator